MNILVFTLATERYAIPLAETRRIIGAVAVTRLPGSPAAVEGVVDVQGTLTPVFDLRRRFGLPARPIGPDDHFILAAAKRRTALLHVDRVEAVAIAAGEKVAAGAEVVVGALAVSGVAQLEEGLVLIHDLDAFLTQAESEALDEALAEAAERQGGSGA